jgi:DNA-binding protein HU-beta
MRRNVTAGSALRKCREGCENAAPHLHVHPPEDVMNKSELIQYVADEAELSRSKAAAIVNLLFDPTAGIIAKSIKKGDAVTLTGFGTFEQRKRGARTFRNPQTGAPVKAKATKVPAFRAGATLKGTIKGGK